MKKKSTPNEPLLTRQQEEREPSDSNQQLGQSREKQDTERRGSLPLPCCHNSSSRCVLVPCSLLLLIQRFFDFILLFFHFVPSASCIDIRQRRANVSRSVLTRLGSMLSSL